MFGGHHGLICVATLITCRLHGHPRHLAWGGSASCMLGLLAMSLILVSNDCTTYAAAF